MTKSAENQRATTFLEFAEQLRRELPGMTRSKQNIAQRVLADPEGVAFMTIAELASLCDVNESTVHRFAVSLGLEGYPALAALCRARLREQALLVQRFEQLSSDHPVDEGGIRSMLHAAAKLDQENIVRTVSLLDDERWRQAVHALSHKRSIYVMGLRKTYSVAHLLAYLLQLVREGVECLTLGDGTLVDRIRDIGEEDCFVPISVRRYMRDTVTTTRLAYERGATTIVLTDNAASPLVPYATHVFFVETNGASILRSMTAFVSIVQALASAVATERGTATRSALLVEEELLHQYGLYHTPPGTD